MGERIKKIIIAILKVALGVKVATWIFVSQLWIQIIIFSVIFLLILIWDE